MAIRPGTFRRCSLEYEAATAVSCRAAGWVIRPSFPGVRQSKFDLLNGWQKTAGRETSELALSVLAGFSRARMMLNSCRIEVRPKSKAAHIQVSIMVSPHQ